MMISVSASNSLLRVCPYLQRLEVLMHFRHIPYHFRVKVMICDMLKSLLPNANLHYSTVAYMGQQPRTVQQPVIHCTVLLSELPVG